MIMVGCPSFTSDALSRNNHHHLNLSNHFNLKPSSTSTSTSTTTSSFLSSSNSRRGGGGGQRRSKFDSREALFLLRRCTGFKQLKQIHAQIFRCGLSDDQSLLNQLLTTLCSSSSSSFSTSTSTSTFNNERRRRKSRRRRMDYATFVFHQIRNPETFTWNLMIRFHTLNAAPHEALLLYNLMIHRGIPPDNFTFPFVIKACLVSSAIRKGKEVHALLIKAGGEFSHDIFVQNTLMDLYFKCGDSVYGRQVFDKMPKRSVVSWTTMIGGLILCGELEAARDVFEVMPPVRRNVVSWSTMINGYARNHQPEEAFELFRRMQLDNVEPNEFTLVSLLVASTELGDVRLGSMIHEFANRKGFELGVFLGTALIDMYSKCSSVEDAIKVFDEMRDKSLATWNTMITSLGVHGRADEALAVFAKMEEEEENVKPDAITFVGVLCACLQTDAVDEGCRYFRYMSERYGIVPITEHYVCMVELLGHAGMLAEAYELVKKMMPLKPNDDIWQVLLRASRAYDNAEIEEIVHKHIEDSTTRTNVFPIFR